MERLRLDVSVDVAEVDSSIAGCIWRHCDGDSHACKRADGAGEQNSQAVTNSRCQVCGSRGKRPCRDGVVDDSDAIKRARLQRNASARSQSSGVLCHVTRQGTRSLRFCRVGDACDRVDVIGNEERLGAQRTVSRQIESDGF